MSDVRALFVELGVRLPERGGPELPTRCFASPAAHKHGDRKASASVNVETGAWYCHGCGARGGAYDAALAVGRTPADAMRLLERFGLVEARVENPPPAVSLPSEDELYHWHAALVSNPRILERLETLRGWTWPALVHSGVGFDGERVVFPARDGKGALAGIGRYAPNPDRRNGSPKLKADPGSQRQLFPAPESFPMSERMLLLTEGEPDALRAISCGLEAVAVPGVQGWRRDWAERFHGRRVLVCFDCDEPGRSAVQRVARDLAGVAREVRLLDLDPAAQNGFDLSDFLALAKTPAERDEARRLLEAAAQVARRCESNGSAPVAVERLEGDVLVPNAGPPEPVHALALLAELVAFLCRFVVLSAAQADALALWIVHTHAIDAADATPYVAITSAEKRSGKSRTFDVLELLVARPWRAITPTEAVTFRKIEKELPTLLLDEVDAIFGPKAREHEGLRALLNAGNRRGTRVPRCVGQSQALVDFAVFGAKALAGIGSLPDTVADRSVPIRLKRKAPGEPVERFRRRYAEADAEPLRERVASWADEQIDQLAIAEQELPIELNDRAADAWEPLLAIADLVGEDWPVRARRAALELSAGEADEDESLGVRLLGDVRSAFDRRCCDRIATADLLAELSEDDEGPWADWRGAGGMTPRGLASLLRRYEIRSRTVRLADGSTPKGYLRDQFEDAWDRYLPESTGSIRHNATTRIATGIAANPDPPQDGGVADRESGANPHGYGLVADVADSEQAAGL